MLFLDVGRHMPHAPLPHDIEEKPIDTMMQYVWKKLLNIINMKPKVNI